MENRFLELLGDGELDLLARVSGHGPAEGAAAWFRADAERIENALADHRTLDSLFSPDPTEPLVLPSPLLVFAIVIGRGASEIGGHQHVVERIGNRQLIPVFDGADLARFTGLSKDYVLRANLRPNIHRFTKELRRNEGTTVGRLDSRFTGSDYDAVGERYEYDPSYSAIQGPYTATLNHYVRTELGFVSDLPYEILTGRVHPWDWNSELRYVNTAEDLRSAMTKNADLRVFVANGYYDLATPYFATEYTFDHMDISPELRNNIELAYYEAGHMMYIHRPSREALKRDLAAFYADAQRAGSAY